MEEFYGLNGDNFVSGNEEEEVPAEFGTRRESIRGADGHVASACGRGIDTQLNQRNTRVQACEGWSVCVRVAGKGCAGGYECATCKEYFFGTWDATHVMCRKRENVIV